MNSPHSPLAGVLYGIALIGAGIILLIYRNRIGEFTGYQLSRGPAIDKPTPGCLFIPFALALIIGGVLIFFAAFE